MKQAMPELLQPLSLPHAEALKLASGVTAPDCPKCGPQDVTPTRQGISHNYKCTECGQSFRLLFAMSDISQLKDIGEAYGDAVLANCNVKIIGKMP